VTPAPTADAERGAAFARLFPKGLRRDSWRFRRTLHLGEIAFFLTVILFATGPLLMLRYTPTPEGAFASVEAITRRVPFGALVRGVHRAASYALIAVLFLHVLRVFYTAAYKEGRRLGWHSGVLLLLLCVAQSYAGYLLPWDQTGYWGTVVGASIASYVPVIGGWLQRMLLGGDDLGAPTLLRFYTAHVAIFPGAIALLIGAHLVALRQAGLASPAAGERPELGAYRGMEVALKLATLFFATLLSTLALAALLPMTLEPPGDPSRARAAWFARGLQELVHHSALFGGIVAPGAVVLLLAALPWIDRGAGRRPSARRGVIALGTALVAAFLLLTVIGNFFRGPSWVWQWPWAK
jgi:quinol-cytochrome oxidoreductase complex cytochrome b subunit